MTTDLNTLTSALCTSVTGRLCGRERISGRGGRVVSTSEVAGLAGGKLAAKPIGPLDSKTQTHWLRQPVNHITQLPTQRRVRHPSSLVSGGSRLTGTAAQQTYP